MTMSHTHETRTTHGIHRGSRPLLALLLTGLLCACGGGITEPERCEAASAVRCTEQSIDQLSLSTTVATGGVQEEGTTPGEFLSFVDASAGGSPPKQSYVYARFTRQGLTRVSLDDQAALASADWDIAFRRYIIRVNSGVAGPSCTAVARPASGASFESVKAVDASWEYHTESYFDDACQFVPDESGIGAPATQMADFWSYESCLAMTGNVYIIQLANGRHVKLEVMGYYDLDAQKVCNDTGKVTSSSSAGHVRIRWAFLP